MNDHLTESGGKKETCKWTDICQKKIKMLLYIERQHSWCYIKQVEPLTTIETEETVTFTSQLHWSMYFALADKNMNIINNAELDTKQMKDWEGILNSTDNTIIIQIHIFKHRITSHDMDTVTWMHRHACTNVDAWKHTWCTDLPVGTYRMPVLTRHYRPHQTVALVIILYVHTSPKVCKTKPLYWSHEAVK